MKYPNKKIQKALRRPDSATAYESLVFLCNTEDSRKKAERKKHRVRRNDREKNSEGSHTMSEWKALLQFFDYQCAACGSTDGITKDHIMPLSKGGSNYIRNIQPLCNYCNSIKGIKTIDYRNVFYSRSGKSPRLLE